tara:strand:+ start:1273 stop:1398 length:126 start_codon:yes stop_codon:yes gene_type:complete
LNELLDELGMEKIANEEARFLLKMASEAIAQQEKAKGEQQL